MGDSSNNEQYLNAINASGFPLQLAAVNDAKGEHGWYVSHQEHLWRNNDGDHGFIDALFKNSSGFITLIAEFKRIKQSNQHRPLLFLAQKNDQNCLAKCFLVRTISQEVKDFE